MKTCHPSLHWIQLQLGKNEWRSWGLWNINSSGQIEKGQPNSKYQGTDSGFNIFFTSCTLCLECNTLWKWVLWCRKWEFRELEIVGRKMPNIHWDYLYSPFLPFFEIHLSLLAPLIAKLCPTFLQTHGLRASLSMGFPRQEYWSGLPRLPPEDLPNPGIEPVCPALQSDSLPSETPGKPTFHITYIFFSKCIIKLNTKSKTVKHLK